MSKKIRIKIGEKVILAEFYFCKSAQVLWENLPIKGKVNLWGKEVYFPIPVKLCGEKLCESVEKGDLAYWPQGNCFCIFFGPTPMSKGDKIIPASKVEVMGRVYQGIEELEKVRKSEEILLEKQE